MNPSTKGSSKFESTRLILVPAANNSIAARPSAASRQSNPSLNSHGTIMSRIGCSSSTRRTRGRSGLGRALARVPVSFLTELINLLNLTSCSQTCIPLPLPLRKQSRSITIACRGGIHGEPNGSGGA